MNGKTFIFKWWHFGESQRTESIRPGVKIQNFPNLFNLNEQLVKSKVRADKDGQLR